MDWVYIESSWVRMNILDTSHVPNTCNPSPFARQPHTLEFVKMFGLDNPHVPSFAVGVTASAMM